MLINFYVHNFIFDFYFIFHFIKLLHHGIFLQVNRSQGQVQHSHSIPSVFGTNIDSFRRDFYGNLLNYIYLVLVFCICRIDLVFGLPTSWYFLHFVRLECGGMLALILCKSLIFLTQSSWVFSWVFCRHFIVIWISF